MANVKDYTAGSPIGARISKVQALKAQIEALEAQLDEEKAYLLGHAIRNNLDGLRCGVVTLSRRERPAWTYTDKVKAAEARLKAQKAAEQKSGAATAKVSEHIVVTFDVKALVAAQAVTLA